MRKSPIYRAADRRDLPELDAVEGRQRNSDENMGSTRTRSASGKTWYGGLETSDLVRLKQLMMKTDVKTASSLASRWRSTP